MASRASANRASAWDRAANLAPIGDEELGIVTIQVPVRPGLNRRDRTQAEERHQGRRRVPTNHVRWRRIHRPARTGRGSRHAETGSSAAQRSTSSARARRGVAVLRAYAIAFRQTASSAGSIEGRAAGAAEVAPAATSRNIAPRSSPSNGGLPVSRQ